MKASIYLLVAAVACGQGAQHASGVFPPAAPDPDAGGPAATDPVPDAGPVATTPPAPPVDAVTFACPGAPIWSRTLTTDADFRGVADSSGNLYWLEFDPWPFMGPTPVVYVVSGDGDGNVRYRVATSLTQDDTEGQFLLAAGKVIVAGLENATVSAFDADTGAHAWTISSSGTAGGIVDLGNGKIAFSFGTGSQAVDVATGTVFAKGGAAGMVASNGQGQILAETNATFDPDTFTDDVQLSLLDGSLQEISGSEVKSAPVSRGVLLAWPSASPWLRAGDAPSAPAAGYLAVPSSWSPAVAGAHTGFSMEIAANPLTIHELQDGVPTGDVTFAGYNPISGVQLEPFLSGDHLLMLASKQHGTSGLCAPTATTSTSLLRVDGTTTAECAMPTMGTSLIIGAALLPGKLIVARRDLLGSCTHDLQPVTIEAYAVPGESLAASGWVQIGGNPGQGMRPVTP